MFNNQELQRDMGKIEHQVAQLCIIFDKKVQELATRVSALQKAMVDANQVFDGMRERLAALESVEAGKDE